MAYKVEFKEVAATGLESSPAAEALAGLRANEARYLWNKYKIEFTTVPAEEDPETLKWIEKILEEREIHFPYKPLEVAHFEAEGTKFAYVFYENGLEVNVMYATDDAGKRAVGFKLSEGITVPAELEGKFKFARQKSKLAGEIRGSYFVIKGKY
ncbi:phage tail protein [Enterococcus sp. BWB1-3]|uniref:phage tail protein n=1 Tax=Enterococcus sp. BWB1-3 TaxID=2787713 RepID=UPI00192102BD|nr:phage tail protein [Enterococcus sp. BWB1-3]MBL1229752.1 phage tail protein [Enterococcus sp. BWB1-3]